ncbi:unnamed protein product [Lathyrus oleraceus]
MVMIWIGLLSQVNTQLLPVFIAVDAL